MWTRRVLWQHCVATHRQSTQQRQWRRRRQRAHVAVRASSIFLLSYGYREVRQPATVQRNDRAKRAREPVLAQEPDARRLTSRQEAMQVDGGKVMRVMLMHALAKRAAAIVLRASGAVAPSVSDRPPAESGRKRGAGETSGRERVARYEHRSRSLWPCNALSTYHP